jgi:hypothetical protein
MGMLLTHDVAVSMCQVMVSCCSFDDDSAVVGRGSFEKRDGIGISIISGDMQEVEHSSGHLNCLAIHCVTGVSSR